ncbi:IS3 family transposase [Hymenobacter sp. APR13]|uniref:IS3 family transposase n=1 Tax=Hymenobacter sp. APR13 TaxID=1356852 RepID=UPI000AEBA0FF|nr:IS3 family transposase [Hymenobacter sp. APR13]
MKHLLLLCCPCWLGSVFASLEVARLEVAHCLDTCFNLDRRHSALGYRSPHQFEQELKSNLP